MLYNHDVVYNFIYQAKIYFHFINKVSNIKVNVDELIQHKILYILKG